MPYWRGAASLQWGDTSLHRGGRLFDPVQHSVYIWYIFGLFPVYDYVLNILLAYLHDLILCFLNMINMILSAYYMYFLFYVEVCEYMKWNYLFVLYMYKCVFLSACELLDCLYVHYVNYCLYYYCWTNPPSFQLVEKGEHLFCRNF